MKLTIEIDEEVAEALERLIDDEGAPCEICPHFDPRIGCVEHGDDCYCLKIKYAIEVARQEEDKNAG